MNTFEGWGSDAVSLVERAIAAHGGDRTWRETRSIRLPFRSGFGPLLMLKGYRHTFPAPQEYEVFPHERVTLFHGYPDELHCGRFSDGNVTIERIDGGGAPLESLNHRRTFEGLAKCRRWSPLDALYFFGYALWHYHVLPFTLGEAHLSRVLMSGGVPMGLEVVFSPEVHTHCRRQQIYFGANGRIVRHDYVAEVMGFWARGAHLWEDYGECGGLAIARRRRVVVQLGGYATPVPALCIQLGQPVIAKSSVS